MRWFVPWLALLALVVMGAQPANPQTNAKARALLGTLEGLPARSDKRLVSGQFTDYGPNARLTTCEDAFRAGGHWPALIGLDYCDFGSGGLHTPTVNALAIDYARHGGLVTLSVHLPNPANPKGGGLRDKGVDLNALLTPGGETHERWIKELDTMADGLAGLQKAGVVVLWRPFHEMNGDWFWWGAKDPDAFKTLWTQMFDHFTRRRGLDNLLWVYSPNQGNRVADYYPGDAYVDVVGLDAYTDHVDPAHIRGYDALLALGKPFGFTEFGPHGASNPPGDYDYTRFLKGVKTHFPRTCFFLAWHGKWALGKNQNARLLMEDPWVLNRDDLKEQGMGGKKDEDGATD